MGTAELSLHSPSPLTPLRLKQNMTTARTTAHSRPTFGDLKKGYTNGDAEFMDGNSL